VRPSQREEVTKSGIVIPDTAKEKPQEGTVIAVGKGKVSDKGDRVALEVKEGDRVLFAKYAAPSSSWMARTCWFCASPTFWRLSKAKKASSSRVQPMSGS